VLFGVHSERLLAAGAVLVNDLQLPQCCILLFGVHSERLLAAVLVNDLRREPERIHNGGMEWDMNPFGGFLRHHWHHVVRGDSEGN
jgi:hypothetical protein